MKDAIYFYPTVPIEETMAFEEIFEEGLQFDVETKRAILDAAEVKLWLYIGKQIVGEAYGITPPALQEAIDEQIPDCEIYNPEFNQLYCYSTAILPKFQGQDLGKLLKACWLCRASALGFSNIIGHSTHPAMKYLNELFGAVHSTKHEDWYGSGRTAYFYTLSN